jgi:ribokinase
MPRIFYISSYVSGFTIRTSRTPVAGETLIGHDFNFGPGGKGFNQAVAASRLGADVGLVMAVGDDYFGKYACEVLEREEIRNPKVVTIPDAPTSAGFVTLSEDGENSILLDPGANQHLGVADIESCAGEIRSADLVVSQLEVPVECTIRAFELAAEAGVPTLLNPAPARNLPPELLRLTDILTPNESESKLLLGLAPDDRTEPGQLAGHLLETGVEKLVMTLGGKGALCSGPDGMLAVQPFPVRPVDTTGAGDSFNAALAVAISRGESLLEAVSWAAAAGAYATQFLGVIDGLPTADQLREFISEYSSLKEASHD